MLSIHDLRVEIADKTILKGDSAEFASGTATLLFGTNGAGKTTLLRTLAGILPAADGTISADGEKIETQSAAWRRRRIFLEAEGGYLEDFSPEEQLRLRATLLGLEREEGELRAAALEAAFDFGKYRDYRASELSTGFKRRLSLALAFMSDARFLLFDEPLNGLDVAGAAAFVLVLDAFTSAGGTAVIASHITGPLLSIVDSIIEIADGCLLRHEASEAFFRSSYGTGGGESERRTFPWLAGRR